jgi:RES domain-containing protein
MTASLLPAELHCYRVGDPAGRYPIFDATGSTLYPGRWNEVTSPMIYTSEHYSTAILEKLVHGSGFLPPNQHFIEIAIPAGVTYEVFSEAHHPGWHAPDCAVARAFGHRWYIEKRSALLLVPSVVARIERNVLIHPDHTDFGRIRPGLHTPIWWDARLFAAPTAKPTP